MIGVFDSGIGGLTVLKALRDRLPAGPFVYLGDTARLPYGTKSGDTIIRYAVQAAGFLAREGITILVVACNTASAYALPALQSEFPGITVIGVIEPGAAAAAKASRNGRIAVLCTESTAKAGAYQSAILRARADATVTTIACPLLVGLAEEGWSEGEVPKAVVRHYIGDLFANPATTPDTIVLGCTHFPLLRAAIAAACPADITIIDSGVTTAEYVAASLETLSLTGERGPQSVSDGWVRVLENAASSAPSPGGLRPPPSPVRERGETRFLATDGVDRFARVAQYFLNEAIDANIVELIDLTG